jgi:subtilisin family serine protease
MNDGTPQFPNFFGTSAAAPAAAAIAALMLEAQPSLSVLEVYKILRETAIDFLDFGFDFDSGYGLCNAPAAVQVASDTRPSHVAQIARELARLLRCARHRDEWRVQRSAGPARKRVDIT